MSDENTLSRRSLFMKVGIFFNGSDRSALGVPIVGYVLSSIVRSRSSTYLSWVPLGQISDFPEGETRLATFKNPERDADRRRDSGHSLLGAAIDGQKFQVFAVNCAHLGCPVRWFPQSGLFMCPCHGGAYYRTAPALRVRRNEGCLNIRSN